MRGATDRCYESGQGRVRALAPARLTDSANLLTENANLHD
jgi:hypothetical protein